MSKVITFGEIMMRLNPPGYQRFLQTNTFEATYAGGEANVAVSLANYGNDAAFVSKVPEHEIGQNAVNALRHYGMDTSMVLRGGPGWAFTTAKREPPNGEAKSFTTGPIPPFRWLAGMNLTGTPSLTEQTGSTLLESHRPWAGNCPKSAWMPARPPKQRESPSAAI